MTTPFICKNTIVRMRTGREGRVVGVDTQTKIAVIKSENTFHTEKTSTLVVVSYKEVE